MAPRIYMAGACAALPDLGVAWRHRMADLIRAAGGVPVWPPDIEDLAYGRASRADVLRDFADRDIEPASGISRASHVRLQSLREVATCHALVWLSDGMSGAGTAAECAFAAWDQIHIERALGEGDMARAVRAAIGAAKERMACHT